MTAVEATAGGEEKGGGGGGGWVDRVRSEIGVSGESRWGMGMERSEEKIAKTHHIWG
jgi:hypothetical protein